MVCRGFGIYFLVRSCSVVELADQVTTGEERRSTPEAILDGVPSSAGYIRSDTFMMAAALITLLPLQKKLMELP